MESPFYGNYWSRPVRPRYNKNIPNEVPQVGSGPVRPRYSSDIKPTAKVVQIPVHFIGSDPERSCSPLKFQKHEPDRFRLALMIQKVFRGFLVRRSLNKIISIKKEVDEIERQLSCSETTALIHRDERERLRVSETLMSLLLKLDSIRGVDSGVRDCRKAVIKKAIYLQEKVDSIVSMSNRNEDEEENQYNDLIENQEENGKIIDHSDVCDVLEQNVEVENRATNDEEAKLEGEDGEVRDLIDEENQYDDSIENQEENGKFTDQTEVSNVLEQNVEEENEAMNDEVAELEEEDGKVGDLIDEENEVKLNESKKNRELLEKMVEENEKMVRMMNELCQRNEVQTRTLNSLAQRVEHLEKAFICDRLKTKNKKKKHPA